jgi:carbonic anhydrase
MSVLDHVLSVNAEFVRTYDSRRATAPVVRKLAIVACMDYRIPLAQALGLNPGDAYVIRNAGGIVTEDVIRSLLVAHYRLGIKEVLIINHTECGMQTFSDEELRTDIRRRRGIDTIAPEQFHSFRNLEDNVRQQIERVKSHPWIPSRLLVNGCIYDVHTGRLTLVLPDDATTRPLPTLPPLEPLRPT